MSLLEGLFTSYFGPNDLPQFAYFDACVRNKKMACELRLGGEEKHKSGIESANLGQAKSTPDLDEVQVV